MAPGPSPSSDPASTSYVAPGASSYPAPTSYVAPASSYPATTSYVAPSASSYPDSTTSYVAPPSAETTADLQALVLNANLLARDAGRQLAAAERASSDPAIRAARQRKDDKAARDKRKQL